MGALRVKSASIAHLRILLKTPFQRLPQAADEQKAVGQQLGFSDRSSTQCGIDIWAGHKKVLNISWNDERAVEVICFQRGEWESVLIELGGPNSR